MYILEIFLKKRKFSTIYKAAWPLISTHIIYPPDTDEEPEQRLVFFGALTYATVYQSCLAAGMSTSAGHHLARILLRNLKFEEWINEAIIDIFAPDDEQAQAYTAGLFSRVGSLIDSVRTGGDAAADDIELAMVEVSKFYRKVMFKSL